jgi:hydroxymethylpyrimidine pyrophosphatase-like HAD family hydrolase
MCEDTGKVEGQVFNNLIKYYVFDVDGVLCDRGKIIDPEFQRWFVDWMQDKNISIVTGNTKDKTILKIGREIIEHTGLCFFCLGNTIYINGNELLINQFTLKEEEKQFINDYIKQSTFEYKTGNHIDIRTGSVNVSLPGQDSLEFHRDLYVKHDILTNERVNFIHKLRDNFDRLDAGIGGDVSVDIFLKGCGKEQILNLFANGHVIYFGDRDGEFGIDNKILQKCQILPFQGFTISNSYHQLKEILLQL